MGIEKHLQELLPREALSTSPEDRAAEILPVLNKHGACAYCNFKDLCIAELEGKTDDNNKKPVIIISASIAAIAVAAGLVFLFKKKNPPMRTQAGDVSSKNY